MGNAQNILEHLIRIFPELSPRLQQAAKYILEHPEEVAIRTMRALAVDAGVAPSTMVRLAHSLDFENYASMRIPFESAMRQRMDTFSDRAQWLKEMADQNAVSKIIGSFASAAMGNLETAFTRNKPETFEDAADILLNARRVFVVGVGAMQFTSGYFQHVVQMALDNVNMADQLTGNQFDDLGDLGSEDVLFCTAFSPYANSSINTIKFAKSRNCKIVVVSDSPISPLVTNATTALLVPTDSPQFFPSQTAVMAILETLLAIIVSKGGDKCVSRIRQIVEFRKEQGYYWQGEHTI